MSIHLVGDKFDATCIAVHLAELPLGSRLLKLTCKIIRWALGNGKEGKGNKLVLRARGTAFFVPPASAFWWACTVSHPPNHVHASAHHPSIPSQQSVGTPRSSLVKCNRVTNCGSVCRPPGAGSMPAGSSTAGGQREGAGGLGRGGLAGVCST